MSTRSREGRSSTAPPPPLRCTICEKEVPTAQLLRTENIRSVLATHFASRYPDRWPGSGLVCWGCVNAARADYLMGELGKERGELSKLEQEVAEKATRHLTLARHLDTEFEAGVTPGQRIADRMAEIGGSWGFVIGFLVVLLTWVVLNALVLRNRGFDPYPFILMNLLLSCVAALQAPVIMMSQNRFAVRDRLQAKLDYQINLKAEIEIASLHEKIDHLLHTQWQRMVELQEMQIDLLTGLAEQRGGEAPTAT